MGQGPVSTHVDAESPIAFQADVELPDHPGLKGVVSGPITFMSPDEFWDLFAKDLRRREPLPPVRSYSSRETKGGGILVIKVLDKGDKLPCTNYTSWALDPTAGKATASDHGADRTLCKVVRMTTVQVLREPFRLALWAGEPVPCESGLGNLLVAMQALLRDELATSTACTAGVPSPDGGGRSSVLSDVIQDSALAPEEAWERLKARAAKGGEAPAASSCASREDPEQGFWRLGPQAADWPRLGSGGPRWMKHVFHDAALELQSHSYGSDDSLAEESLEMVLHLKVHVRPYRLEMWVTLPPNRLAGEAEQAFAAELFGPLARRAEEQSRKQQSQEAQRAFMNEVREEMTSSQDALRKELQALSAEVKEISRSRRRVPAA